MSQSKPVLRSSHSKLSVTSSYHAYLERLWSQHLNQELPKWTQDDKEWTKWKLEHLRSPYHRMSGVVYTAEALSPAEALEARLASIKAPKEEEEVFAPIKIKDKEETEAFGVGISGVIFDMDGTLTEPGAINFAEMYDKCGLDRKGGIYIS